MKILANFCLIIGSIQVLSTEAFVPSNQGRDTCPLRSVADDCVDRSRRDAFASIMSTAIVGSAMLSSPSPASAAPDCLKDCIKNCLIIAPKVSVVSEEKTVEATVSTI